MNRKKSDCYEEELKDVDRRRRDRKRRWEEIIKREREETFRNMNMNMKEDEIDPLDAFMNSIIVTPPSDFKNSGIIPGDDDSENDHDPVEEEVMKTTTVEKKSKVEKLSVVVDHSKIKYIDFRKNFYIQVSDIKNMTQETVAAYRKQAELKVHGKDVPKPIQTWCQTGLTTRILDTIIRKLKYEKPTPIQAQALPVIMSGRDCIAVAKTGSGKTLAFVLPMLRHIMHQPELSSGDGPIGLIMAPTRELVKQIHTDIARFTKVLLGLRCVPVYGGSDVAQQIRSLKRGAEIVVCTPGRMIDMLCGKITNLRRVSYLVVDEADRMFDMGFEPQITRIVQNTQPNRQTVLFSATFSRRVEVLARRVLNKPVEIQVGGRSVVNKDITQLVELRPENQRFCRLLELLGEWYEKGGGKILIFVQSQEKCDALFLDLFNHGYPCLSLHGAKDQSDREYTICNFKSSNGCSLLVATSIASRGLDVKELGLVINYDVPNHYEDYVHRVGRTGRAGRKGCAVTFLSREEERYAPDLVKALELSNQVVPDDLRSLADGFMAKGVVQAHGSGYGGSGFKFNEEEEQVRKAAKKAQAKEHGFEQDESDSDDDGGDVSQAAASQQPARAAAAVARIQAGCLPECYEAELEINDFPQKARWKLTHKETLGPISEWAGAAITTRGQYIQPGRILGPGERKLYLFIEGGTEHSVKRAKAELERVLQDITAQALSFPNSQPHHYPLFESQAHIAHKGSTVHVC